jgi:hypothetical protein
MAKCLSFLISCLVSFYIMTTIIPETKVFLSHCHKFMLQNLCMSIIYNEVVFLQEMHLLQVTVKLLEVIAFCIR